MATPSQPSCARVIGLLGGMSWPSTITYYREINRAVQQRLGGSHSARLLLWSDDYQQVEQMQLTGDWDTAARWIAESALRLEAGGAEILGIACNTMHKVSAAVRASSQLPLVDLIEETAIRAADLGVTRAAILGTRFTRGMSQYPDQLRQRGIEPVLPPEDDCRALDQIIYDELCRGVVSAAAATALEKMIARLVAQRVDGVVLACTELSLLMGQGACDEAHLIDSSQVHVDALVNASLAGGSRTALP